MATTTRHIGLLDHGRRATLDEFATADFEEGWLYELAGGMIVVTEVPGIHHGRIVDRITRVFVIYDASHPGVINYPAGSGECRLRMPGMQSDRHPDQAVYLTPPPPGGSPWARWVPDIVVEVVSDGGEERDYVEKRDEYLHAGVAEYWILDPLPRRMVALRRVGDEWQETALAPAAVDRTPLLPGLEIRPDELFGPPELR